MYSISEEVSADGKFVSVGVQTGKSLLRRQHTLDPHNWHMPLKVMAHLRFIRGGKAGEPKQEEIGHDSRSDEKMGDFQAFFDVIMNFVGTGILGLPYAFRHAGYITGTILLLLVGLLMRKCILMLIDCRVHMLELSGASYGDVADRAFGQKGKRFLNSMLAFGQMGVCTVYIIFVGQNVSSVFPSLSYRLWAIVFFPIFLSLALVRRMSALAIFSSAASFAMVFSLSTVLGYTAKAVAANDTGNTSASEFLSLPIFLAMATYAYSGMGLMLPIRNSMRKPQDFGNVLNIAMVIMSILFLAVGLGAYMVFGDKTKDIIIMNLPHTDLILAVKLALSFGMMMVFPLQLFPVTEMAEKYFVPRIRLPGEEPHKHMELQEHTEDHPFSESSSNLMDSTKMPRSDSASSLDAMISPGDLSNGHPRDDSRAGSATGSRPTTPVHNGSGGPPASPTPVTKADQWMQGVERLALKRNIVRISLTVVCLLIALSVPNFGLVLSLLGALDCSTMSFIIPAACYLKLNKGELTSQQKITPYIALGFGVFVLFSGTIVAVKDVFSG